MSARTYTKDTLTIADFKNALARFAAKLTILHKLPRTREDIAESFVNIGGGHWASCSNDYDPETGGEDPSSKRIVTEEDLWLLLPRLEALVVTPDKDRTLA